MSESLAVDVFSLGEVARAAGIPLETVRAAVSRGDLGYVPGTRFFTFEAAAAAAGRLRELAVAMHHPAAHSTFTLSTTSPRAVGRPAVISLVGHGMLAVAAVWMSWGRVERVAVDTAPPPTHLVFLQNPGPGGGGGGGGARQPRPAPRLLRKGSSTPQLSTPPVHKEPASVVAAAPPPPQTTVPPVIAPVQPIAAAALEWTGTVAPALAGPDARGPGADAGVGSNRGSGDGRGVGSGIDDGFGGGTGGGPYRPGSGVDAPRLLNEVKAQYTEEARVRNITGEVLLEAVIRRDGTVGSVRVVRGLGSGLDERAMYAVRQWRFAPARRRGDPVDVVVEIAVDFNLR